MLFNESKPLNCRVWIENDLMVRFAIGGSVSGTLGLLREDGDQYRIMKPSPNPQQTAWYFSLDETVREAMRKWGPQGVTLHFDGSAYAAIQAERQHAERS